MVHFLNQLFNCQLILLNASLWNRPHPIKIMSCMTSTIFRDISIEKCRYIYIKIGVIRCFWNLKMIPTGHNLSNQCRNILVLLSRFNDMVNWYLSPRFMVPYSMRCNIRHSKNLVAFKWFLPNLLLHYLNDCW